MLTLQRTNVGEFDLAWETPEDERERRLLLLQTLVYAALFTDAQIAPAHHSRTDRFDRRGWWADPQMGSGLWHVRRQALSINARAETLTLIRQALATVAQAGGFESVVVTDTSPAGSVSLVSVSIEATYDHDLIALPLEL